MARGTWLLPGLALVLGIVVGVPGATAGPQTINKCQSISESGSYVLGKNLVASGFGRGGFDCLRLGADSITVDLNGFTITGKQGAGRGIRLANGFSGGGYGFEIRNGTIQGFARGIDLRVIGGSPGKNRVERMRLLQNSEFGLVMTGTAIVRDSIVFNNGTCIFADGCPEPSTSGDGINVGPNSIVSGNTSFANTGHGIWVGPGSTVTGNSANGNGQSGLAIGAGSTVTGNTAVANAIGLSIVCPSNVVGNTATDNGQNLALTGDGCNTEHNVAP